ISETKFESVKIVALSKSPERAKAIIDEIIYQLNSIIKRTSKKILLEDVEIKKAVVEGKREQMDILLNKISKYSEKYKLVDYSAQSEEVTKGYLKFLIAGKKGK